MRKQSTNQINCALEITCLRLVSVIILITLKNAEWWKLLKGSVATSSLVRSELFIGDMSKRQSFIRYPDDRQLRGTERR